MIAAAWKLYTIGGLAAATIASAGLYLHERDKGVRKDALREVAVARADSLTEVADSLELIAYRKDSTMVEARIRADSIREDAENRVRRARAVQPEIVERIVLAPDTAATRAAVVELQEAHREEVTALEDALIAADSVIEAQSQTLTAMENVNAGLRKALDAANAAAGIDTREGFVERWGERIGWAAGGVVVGYLATG